MVTTRSLAIRFGVSRSWPIKSPESTTFFYNFDFLLKQFFDDFFLQPAIVGAGVALSGVLLRRFSTHFEVDVFLQDAHLLDWLLTKPGFFLRKLSKTGLRKRQRVSVAAKLVLPVLQSRKLRIFSFSRRTFHRPRKISGVSSLIFSTYSRTRKPIRAKLRRSLRIRRKLAFFRRKKRRFFFSNKLKKSIALLRYVSIYRAFKRRKTSDGSAAAEFKLRPRRRKPLQQAQYQWHIQKRKKLKQFYQKKKRSFRFSSSRPKKNRYPRLFPRPKFFFSRFFFRHFARFFRFRFLSFVSRFGVFLAFQKYGLPVRIRLNFVRRKNTAQYYLNYITTKLYYRYILSDVINPIVRLSMKYYKGFRIVCKGRFTRAQMATERIYRRGSLQLSSLYANLDYAQKFVVLKYGACNLKIWLRY